MKLCITSVLRKLTKTDKPQEQVAFLRSYGLNPFVCPKTGRPIITELAINEGMMRASSESNNGFEMNMGAFGDDAA